MILNFESNSPQSNTEFQRVPESTIYLIYNKKLDKTLCDSVVKPIQSHHKKSPDDVKSFIRTFLL